MGRMRVESALCGGACRIILLDKGAYWTVRFIRDTIRLRYFSYIPEEIALHSKRWLVTIFLTLCASLPASAEQLLTGGSSGAYYNDIGPRVHEVLNRALFRYPLVEGKGSVGNFNAILEQPTVVALGQHDVYALMNKQNPGQVVSVPTQVRECLFAVTANPGIAGENPGDGWGNMMSLARRLRVALPGAESGSAKTFEFIQTVNDSLAQVGTIEQYPSTSDMVDAVVADEVDVGFFVQMPDTRNELFKKIKEHELSWIGVGDRAMLNQTVDGESIYSVDTVPVEATWGGFGTPMTLTTTCTQVVIMTGDPARADVEDRTTLQDQVALLQEHRGEYEPEANWYQDMTDKIRSVGKDAKDTLLESVDKASKAVNEALN